MPTVTKILKRVSEYKLEAINVAGGELDPLRWHGVKIKFCFFDLPYLKVDL